MSPAVHYRARLASGLRFILCKVEVILDDYMRCAGRSFSACLELRQAPHAAFLLHCRPRCVHALLPLLPTLDTRAHLASEAGRLKRGFYSSWKMVLLYIHPLLVLYLLFSEPGSYVLCESGGSFA